MSIPIIGQKPQQGIAITTSGVMVVMLFSHPTSAAPLSPKTARAIAADLIRCAMEAETNASDPGEPVSGG